MRGARRDRYGIRAYVKVAGQQRQKRFSSDTPTSVIKTWRENTRAELRAEAGLPSSKYGLAADVAAYLPQVEAMPTYAQRKQHLELWTAALGPKTPRPSITPQMIRAVLQQWRAKGLSAASCNKRRTALMHLWSVLDGKGARNPVRDVPKFRVADPLPRGRDLHTIDAALLARVQSRMRATCRVLLWCGLRPEELRRAEPDDIDWRQHLAIIRTAKGGRTRAIPLTPQAMDAWREFDRLDCWHHVPTSPPLNRWLKHITGIPSLRLYDLRHSWGTALALREVRLDVIGALMGHRTLELTKRYTLAAVTPDAEQAARKLTKKAVTKAVSR